MSKTIILYTHTDMKDIWTMCFGQMQKYLQDYKVYVFVNERSSEIPSQYNQVIYDDTLAYTRRLDQCLQQVTESIVLFMHEDMILYDTPNYEFLEMYTALIENNQVDGVKLILVGDNFIQSFAHSTLVVNEHSKFSVQPTLIKKETFQDLVQKAGSRSIWDFEASVPTLQFFGYMVMVRIGNEKKRGLFHYDSPVFPYIATAIVKGKWNYSEYKNELDTLFQEYKINSTTRGIV